MGDVAASFNGFRETSQQEKSDLCSTITSLEKTVTERTDTVAELKVDVASTEIKLKAALTKPSLSLARQGHLTVNVRSRKSRYELDLEADNLKMRKVLETVEAEKATLQ